jgi:GTP-binding protein EngB required for normal cell division
MARQWRKWPARFAEQANSAGGVVGLLSGVSAVGASVVGLPTIVTAAPAIVTGGAIAYCLLKAWPEKSLKANAMIGETVTNLKDLALFEPQLTRVGFLGPSQVGKTTTLSNLSVRHATPNVRTDSPYATVALVPGQPVKYFAFIDAAGQQFAQQFKVAETSDLVFVFLDHAPGESETSISQKRLREHEEFLLQLKGYLGQAEKPVSSMHFILNKRDKWESNADADKLRAWFDKQISPWKNSIGLTVSSAFHSNFITSDNTTLVNLIRDRVN